MDQAEEDALRQAASWAVARGSLLFHLDLAGALARDHVAARGLAADADAWLVDVGANGYEVVFLSDRPWREVLAVTFGADGAPIAEPRTGTPSPRQRALAAAMQVVGQSASEEQRAIIVVPPAFDAPAGTGLEAYAMRVAERSGEIAFGVHHRFWLSADGREVQAAEPLSRSPLVIGGSNGRPQLDVTITHFGQVPGEAHVYLSLKHGVPLSVVTVDNDEHWIVDGETISLL